MTFSFRPARRSEAKPLIGLYAESGAGKTYSALLLARGFVGENGRIGMIETEAGRGEAYADLVPGGYDVLPIRGNFAPKNFGEAIAAAEAAKYDALIIDSASHEWESEGGVLSMAAENQAAGKTGPIVWQRPKMEHAKHFMLKLLSTSVPLVVVCMRAHYPMTEKKKADGKKEWVRSETLDPKQANDILFEMFVHGWIDREHRFHVTKLTRPDLAEVFVDQQPISIETGRKLAAWAKAAPVAPERRSAVIADEQNMEDESARLSKINETLRAAALKGSIELRAEWGKLSPADQKILKASLDRLHKPAAAEADTAAELALLTR